MLQEQGVVVVGCCCGIAAGEKVGDGGIVGGIGDHGNPGLDGVRGLLGA